MKNKTLWIATTLAALGLMATACKPKVIDSGIRYVAVKDGLNMREEPSPTGKKMLTISYRQEVQKLEEKPESFTIDKTEGKWTKVSWRGKTGWVFGGFLSSNAPDAGSTQGATNASNRVGCKATCDENLEKSLALCRDIERNSSHRAGLAELVEQEYQKCKSSARSEAESCGNNCS